MTRSLTPARPPETAARWSWVDLRLAPVAAAVWLTTLLAPLVAPSLLGWVALAACVLAVPVARRPAAVTALLLTVLAGVAVASATAAVRGRRGRAHHCAR